MAEGFRFHAFGFLLDWEHFGSTHGLVRCNINTGVHKRARAEQTYHSGMSQWPRWETGLQSESDVTHQKCTEDCGNLKKVSRVETRHRTRRVDFRLLMEALGRCRTRWVGADEKARIGRLCLSLLMSKNL